LDEDLAIIQKERVVIMYIRVLIADDELLARNQLRALIDWEQHGYVLCGEAEDGVNAIRLAEELHPHIMLIDIDMPLMDGVSLCRYISEHHKDIQTIILSNFDNFDFVRDTLNSGAIDYLLKHRLTSDGLLDILEKASERLPFSSLSIGNPDASKPAMKHPDPRQYPVNLQELASQLVGLNGSNSTSSNSSNSTTGSAAHSYTEATASLIKKYAANTIVLVMQMLNDVLLTESHSEEKRNMFIRSSVELCQQLVGDARKGCVTYTGEGRFIFVLSYSEYRSEAPVHQSVQAFMDKVVQTLSLIYNVAIAFGQSPLCHQADKIPDYYRLACEELTQKLNKTGSQVGSSASTGTLSNSDTMALTIRQEKELLAAIVIHHIPQIEAILDQVFDAFALRPTGYPQVVFLIEELTHLAHRVGKKCSVDVSWISQEVVKNRPKLGHLPEVKEWVKAVYRRLVEDIRRLQTQHKYTKYVEEAMKLIRSHYITGISLEEVADRIGITPSYLSRLFKEETGTSFTEAINYLRIELSKQYIENGDPNIKDMYRRFGFNNYNYFFKVFKDIVGETPHSYAKKYLENH
jgi:two-component system response regulator YesN